MRTYCSFHVLPSTSAVNVVVSISDSHPAPEVGHHLSPEYIVLDCSFVSGLDGNAVDGFLKLQASLTTLVTSVIMDTSPAVIGYTSMYYTRMQYNCAWNVFVEKISSSRSNSTSCAYHFCGSAAIPTDDV
jgi:hypothetical protein